MAEGDQPNANHNLIAAAVEQAATTITDTPTSFRENKIEHGVGEALGERLGAHLVSGPTRFPIPDWTNHLGGIDLVVRHSRDGDPRLIAELKVESIEETLWDLFKMVAAAQLPGVEDAFLVAAAPQRRWDSERDCVALFPSQPQPATRWSSGQLFERWRGAWEWLLKGGTARPLRVPRTVETVFIANHPVHAYPDYELRAVAVRSIPEDGWLPFDGDWPARID